MGDNRVSWWNHRVIKHPDGEGWCYALHEVRYRGTRRQRDANSGNPKLIVGWTVLPTATGETLDELRDAVSMMWDAVHMAVETGSGFQPDSQPHKRQVLDVQALKQEVAP